MSGTSLIVTPASRGVTSLWHAVAQHAPIILTVVAACGAVTSVVMAIKATPEAERRLEEKKKEIAVEHDMDVADVDLTLQEMAQAAGKCYIPTIAVLTVSVGCMFGAAHINNQRQLGWAALYSATKKASDAYERAVIEHVGEKENKVIREKVIHHELEDNPASRAQIIDTGRGSYLCYDSFSGRYFMSDIEDIRRKVNDLNQEMLSCMYIKLNEFYQEIGLPPIEAGNEVGWNTDELIEVSFTTMLSDDGHGKRPCLVLEYDAKPRHSFNKLY